MICRQENFETSLICPKVLQYLERQRAISRPVVLMDTFSGFNYSEAPWSKLDNWLGGRRCDFGVCSRFLRLHSGSSQWGECMRGVCFNAVSLICSVHLLTSASARSHICMTCAGSGQHGSWLAWNTQGQTCYAPHIQPMEPDPSSLAHDQALTRLDQFVFSTKITKDNLYQLPW